MPSFKRDILHIRENLESRYELRKHLKGYSGAARAEAARGYGDQALRHGEYNTALHAYEQAKDPDRLMALGSTILGEVEIPKNAGRIAVEAMEQARKLKPEGEAAHGKIVRGSFYSPSLGKEMRYNVYLPPGYDSAKEKYPAIYFFNAAGGNQNEWLVVGKINKAVDELMSKGLMSKAIIVMPDMENGTILNHDELTAPMKIVEKFTGKGLNYENYVVNDLIPQIDGRFRTVADRRGRATDGICQGATNAVSVALKHPDMFLSAAGHTAGYGNIKLGERAKDVKVYLDASVFDPIYVLSRNFSKQLEKSGVNHVFTGYRDGIGAVKKEFWRDVKKLARGRFSPTSVAAGAAMLSYASLTPHNWTAFRKRVKNSLMFHSANFENAGKTSPTT